MRLDVGKLIGPANSYTLIHYPFTVALLGLADWSALSFADHVKSRVRQWGPQRALDERNGSEMGPCVSEMSPRPSRLVWGCSWHLLES